jgi:DNA polymerase-1
MYDVKKVEEKYGVKPNQLIDIFALTGDVVDNVAGIKGIGNKTAVKLLKEYGTLKNILQNAGSIKGRVGKLLQHGRDNAELSKKLIELDFNVPLDYKLNNFENKDLDVDEAVSFFERHEFKSLVGKYSQQEL